MELKVWVDGVQRIVCGVTEATTCQEVVIALAQAIGRTGRYTLIEKWRDSERHLAPHENPVIALNKWGQYASDVQLILRRTGPSLSERPTSDSIAHVPERNLYRQSLPPLAKLRPQNDKSIKRREPKRKSLTFTGGAKGLMDIFGKGKESEFKQKVLNNCRTTGEDLKKLIHLQSEKLLTLEKHLDSSDAEMRYWEQKYKSGLEGEIGKWEQKIKRNDVEIGEEEFWENEFQIEVENEKQLKEQLEEMTQRMLQCESQLKDYQSQIQTIESGIEAERLQMAMQETQINEEIVRGKIEKIKGDMEVQGQESVRLENGAKAVERSLGQAAKRLLEREQELEQLTKELRQVNLQQFIQQTGTKVTVLPAEPSETEFPTPEKEPPFQSGSLKRPVTSRQLPSNLRILQNALSSGFNPEGIYV
ncbi:ras association domain-containing protein 8 [Hyla sarda]|uniref:ras association domain-containing protein 8 n=1 Tax=Hyla sarda TaxID=327740 RepID=UPI0024C4448F|nr:ras association domain-containing protein 8 [Hyla sarda]XP_056373578.1 ras association domain-containing protein 8 [Hyla sarda]XP_056373579.1 ras association domain-containing protein 8 [Hyla sarda]XP_056373580.1 ras association domain-containing protein 8 [Hyla sarda]XP_056373581.1 ras association domain-containing protein 8 [Hyla sarda]XP_056373582.1 ras association domain-containing protein 8 [Hyla sarda]XP_056373583.1 ras association domain-containing protein 8 [Hyla sarda]